MKKILSVLSFLCLISTIGTAQTNLPSTPEEMLDRAKRIYRVPLIEKAHISEAQADKVVAIIADAQLKMRTLTADASISGDARMKQLEEIRAERDKKFKAIPLTDDQIKSVSAAIDEIRRNMQVPKQ
jgi:hypothetical protein